MPTLMEAAPALCWSPQVRRCSSRLGPRLTGHWPSCAAASEQPEPVLALVGSVGLSVQLELFKEPPRGPHLAACPSNLTPSPPRCSCLPHATRPRGPDLLPSVPTGAGRHARHPGVLRQ